MWMRNIICLMFKFLKKLCSSYNSTRNFIQLKDYSDALCATDYKHPKAILIGMLSGEKYNSFWESARRVYSIEGICPTLTTSQRWLN